MDELKERWGVSAWKTYTQYGPGRRGYFMTDEVARERLAYLERPEPHFRTYGPKTRREFLAFTACCN